MAGTSERTLASTRRRGRGRPWPKGVSGNPSGRPSMVQQWERVLGATLTPDRMASLLESAVKLAEDGDTKALQLILDRLWPVRHVLAGDPDAPLRVQTQPIAVDRAQRIVALLRTVGALESTESVAALPAEASHADE